MTIGRKPFTKVGIANNRYMPNRANAHLENYAISKAEHFETSLKVDAPRFYFWNKRKGSVPCSCTAANLSYNNDIDPGEPNTDILEIIKPLAKTANNKYSSYELVDTDSPDVLDKINDDEPLFPRKKESFHKQLFDSEVDSDEIGNQIEDVIDPEEVAKGNTDFHDPFNLFSDRTIQCPICMGSGFIDSYDLYAGKRFVFETSDMYHFYSENADIDETANPTKIHLHKTGNIFWSFQLPRLWLDILKIEVYSGQDIISPEDYTFHWIDSANNSGPLSISSLNSKNNTGEVIKLQLTALDDLIVTHAVIIFSYANPHKAQIPEVAQGWEQEFLDWNTSVTMELPPTIDIREGSYVTESKYGKVWKVSALTPRFTEGGTVFGLTAEVRALQPMEKKFYHFKLFDTRPRNQLYSNPYLRKDVIK